jgi:TetR/AcrR family transcriptional regulator
MTPARLRTRKPGRPASKDAPNSRAALVAAARELFAEHAFAQVSTHQIAAAAGLNPAMIRYHFGDKAGLLEATFRETVGPVLEELVKLSSAGRDPLPLQRFFEIYMRTLAANPWLPKFIVRHVLPERGPLQKLVVTELAARLGPAVALLIGRGQTQRALRADLDPVLTTLSIVSLAIFPFLSLPVTKQVFDLKVDADFIARLTRHTAELFYRGAARGSQPEASDAH